MLIIITGIRINFLNGQGNLFICDGLTDIDVLCRLIIYTIYGIAGVIRWTYRNISNTINHKI